LEEISVGSNLCESISIGEILDGGNVEVLSSPGCYCRRNLVHGATLSLSLVLSAYHSRDLGGQGEPLLCLLCFVFHVRGMIVRGGGTRHTFGGSAGL
jgi:hypothetical protein